MHTMCSETHLHFDYARLAWDTGFCFDEIKHKSAFDINVLSLVDVEKVLRDRDIITVEKHIPTVLQFCLDDELAKILDPTFVKIFRLSQFALQYLRFCNKYLDNTVILLKKDLATAKEEISDLETCAEELKNQNEMLKNKNDDLRATLQNINQAVSFKCDECSKTFASEDFLYSHKKRRHESIDSRSDTSRFQAESEKLQAESEKLQLEIKELKQRLNNTEKCLQLERVEPNNDNIFDKEHGVQEKFEQLKEHIEKELSALRDEAFYKNIYEKWYEEVQRSQKKTLVEQSSECCIQIVDSSTQTQLNDVEIEEVNDADVQTDAVEEIQEIEDSEERMKKEVEAHRGMLETIIESKLTDSLERFENNMSQFWKKLSDLELKRQNQALARNIKVQQPLRIFPHINETNFIKPKQKQVYSDSEDSDSTSVVVIKRPSSCIAKSNTYSSPVKTSAKIVNEKLKRASSPCLKSDQTTKVSVKKELKELKNIPAQTQNKAVNATREESNTVSKLTSSPSKIVENIISSGTDNECSELSDDSISAPILIVPSKASTLAQRSVSSLKSAARDADVIEGLKSELRTVVDEKLKEIGVAAHWKGLPEKTFKHAQSVIAHQANIAKKTIPNYTKVQNDILKVVSRELTASLASVNKNKDRGDCITNESSDEKEIKVIKAPIPVPRIMKVSSPKETLSRSVLKSQPNQWTSKKKVLFNLNDEAISSTSTINSEAKSKNDENKENDISDWEINDINSK